MADAITVRSRDGNTGKYVPLKDSEKPVEKKAKEKSGGDKK